MRDPRLLDGIGSLCLVHEIIFALPEGWVTFHSGDMGYTFCLCEESKGALAGV